MPPPLAQKDAQNLTYDPYHTHNSNANTSVKKAKRPPTAHEPPPRDSLLSISESLSTANPDDDLALAISIPPTDACCGPARAATLRVIESPPLQCAVLTLVCFDVALTIAQLVANSGATTFDEHLWMFYTTMVIVSLLLLEVLLRLACQGPSRFFHHWSNVLDLVVTILSFALELVVYELARQHAVTATGTESAAGNLAFVRAVRPLARIARICRVCMRGYNTRRNLRAMARRVVSQNKRRFVEDGWDIDLVYVTEDKTLVGMSTPAAGATAMYRNNVADVARFFNTRHEERYWIYNVTAECQYPVDAFHGRFSRYAMDDHNVMPLWRMRDFCAELERRSAAEPGMCSAIHCRGGKGRTGLMVCAWLLHSRACTTAKEALALWARRRTDDAKPGKEQGVQTASQVRYVSYVERILRGGPPDEAPRNLRTLRIRSLFYPQSANGTKGGSSEHLPWVVLSQFSPCGRLQLDTRHATPGCVARVNEDLVINLGERYQVRGDLKMEIFVDSKSVGSIMGGGASHVPQGRKAMGKAFIEGAPPEARGKGGATSHLIFYSWVHAGYVAEQSATEVLRLTELDKGVRTLFKCVARRGVSVELTFDKALERRGSFFGLRVSDGGSPPAAASDADKPEGDDVRDDPALDSAVESEPESEVEEFL